MTNGRLLLLIIAFSTLFFRLGWGEETTTTLDLTKGNITLTDVGYTQGENPGTSGTEMDVTIKGGSEGEPTKNYVFVESGTHTITLEGVNIQFDDGNPWSPGTCAFSIASVAKVKLILKGENTLKSGWSKAGLQVPEGAKVEISEGGGSGSLMANGGPYGAGIGGGSGGSGGTITISGGTVTANGSQYGGAGIGGGKENTNGVLALSGGTIITSSINADITVKPGSGAQFSESDEIKTTLFPADHTLTIEKDASLTINNNFDNKGKWFVYGTLAVSSGATLTNSDNGGILAVSSATCPEGIEWLVQVKEDELLTENYLVVGGGTENQHFTFTRDELTGNETIEVQEGSSLTFRTAWPVLRSYISVPNGVTADITLDGCRIIEDNDFKVAPLSLNGTAKVTLRFSGSNKLQGGKEKAGIRVPENASLTIKGEGELDAKGGTFGAGIGGNCEENAGAIRIESGTITVEGGTSNESTNDSGGAGIGGGGSNSGKAKSHTKIIITGGHVVAKGGKYAFGVGTGRRVNAAAGAEISIEGGYVKVPESYKSKSVIGSDYNCGTINIKGGTIDAETIGSYRDGYSGTFNISGGSVKGKIKNISIPLSLFPLTLESIESTVNSVSVDNTPYYIDQGYPDDDNKDKLYLYVPKETKKVYVREGDAIATYTVAWTGDTPSAIREEGSSTLKQAVLAYPSGGLIATVGEKAYTINGITVADQSSTSAAAASPTLAMNSLSVKLTDTGGKIVYETRLAAEVNVDGTLSAKPLDLSSLPCGTYTMALQYGGDASWLPSDEVTATLTIEKKTPAATDFRFTAPFGGSPVYDGSPKEAQVEANSGITGIGEIEVSYYKKDDTSDSPLTEAVDAGTYTVKITVTEGTDYKATETPLTGTDPWTFTIAPMAVTATPDADQIVFNKGKNPEITYQVAPGFVERDKEKVSITGALSFEKKSEDTYQIINPATGGLALDGENAGNYKLSFSTTPVPLLVYAAASAAEVEASLDGVSRNENGWITSAPFTLTAPVGFTFADDKPTYKITGDTESYTLLYKGSSYLHPLYVDATAPVVPTEPTKGNLSATFVLEDAASGIASYTVKEGDVTIYSYTSPSPDQRARAAVTPVRGEKRVEYTYTGEAGDHTLSFTVTDMAGHTTGPSERTFTLTKVVDPDTPGNPGDPGIPEDPSIPDDPDDPDTPVDPDPVANGQVAADATQVWTSGAVLHIHLPSPEAVAIYTFTGRLYKVYSTLSDDTTLWLPQGNYIVVTGGERFKVQVGR